LAKQDLHPCPRPMPTKPRVGGLHRLNPRSARRSSYLRICHFHKRTLLRRQSAIVTTSHNVRPPRRASPAFHEGNVLHTTIAKQTKPRLPKADPFASSAAAFRPRTLSMMPDFRFFRVSCFSTKVALAGKIAGNAKNKPPNTGPACFAMTPADTVTAPPRRNRSAYSYHFVLLSPGMSN